MSPDLRLAAATALVLAACSPEALTSFTPRRALASASLDGRIYASGGWNGAATQLDAVQELDASTGRWRAAVPLRQPRSQHGMVAADGRLWLVAGWAAGKGLVPEVETWAPGEPAWRAATILPTPRREPGVALLGRRIVVAGGFNGASDADLDGYSAVVEAYDIDRDAWSTLGRLNSPRRGLALVNAGGVLYAIGGYSAQDGFLRDVERYDPTANAWQELEWNIAPRTWLAALADDGDVVLIGGFSANGPLDALERVRPDDGRVCSPPSLRMARSWLAAELIGPALAVSMGGESADGYSAAVEINSLACPGGKRRQP